MCYFKVVLTLSSPIDSTCYNSSHITILIKSYSDPVTGPVWPRGWVDVQLYSSMTAALEGGKWSAARPDRT